jgi:hypothetical protein
LFAASGHCGLQNFVWRGPLHVPLSLDLVLFSVSEDEEQVKEEGNQYVF